MSLLLALSAVVTANAQSTVPADTVKGPTKWISIEEQKEKLVFFQGFTLSADILGPVFYAVSDYGFLEAALRLNLKNTYLPVVELGYATCDNLDFNTKVSYKTTAPYARIGIDFNLLKNKFQANRLYAGLRYGISKFSYDVAGPEVTDPVWGGSAPFNFESIDCTGHWAEIVFGAEVQMFKNFHMGWLLRHKREISSTTSSYAKPNCIPGYGYATTSSCWGATYSLIFDLNWGLKKSKRKGYVIEVRERMDVNDGKKADKTEEEEEEEEEEGVDNEVNTEDEEDLDEENEEEEGTEEGDEE